MFPVKYDAVLVVIYIRRILESPFLSLDGDGDDAVVLPCRVVQASRISFVFHAELAFRVGGGLRLACRGDGFWIFLRLGEVDRDVQSPVLCIYRPFAVPFDAVTAYVVAVLA